MVLYNLDILERDSNQDGLYDLFTSTFKSSKSVELSTYNVSSEQSMRMDIISKEVYKSTEYLDLIMDLNEIDNPLNIMMGDELRNPPFENIQFYRLKNTNFEINKNQLIDVEKQTNVDPNRKKYVEQNYKVTPTTNESPQDPVSVYGRNIRIGGN
jgi:hypothetical protein